MHGLLYENQGALWGAGTAVFNDFASQLNLDVERFQACMDSGEMQERVKRIDQEVKSRGVRVRPTFDLIVDGQEVQRLPGSPTLDQWRQVLDGLQ